MALIAIVPGAHAPTHAVGSHKQIYSTDCTDAAMQDALDAYGVHTTQRQLTLETGWTPGSGTGSAMATEIMSYFLGSETELYNPHTITLHKMRALARMHVPVILTVDANLLPWYAYAAHYTTPTWHSIVLDGFASNGDVKVFDVACGWRKLTARQLSRITVDAIWHKSTE